MTIGPTLKQAREKKDFTFEDVHAKIKIHPRVLQLLEEEKFEKLPSPLFAKSFLRSYAQFLEVNAEELIEKYDKEKAAPEPEQKLYIRPAGTPERRISPAVWAGGIAVALLFLFALFGSPFKAHLAKSKKSPVTKTEKAKPVAAKKAEEPAKPKEKPAEAEQVDSEWLNSVKLGNFPKLKRNQPLELELKAVDAVWVHVTVDGKVLFQGVLKKGAAEKWPAKSGIEIWTGNAANMTLSLNKTSLGSPGKGVVKKMIITHEGVRIAPPSAE